MQKSYHKPSFVSGQAAMWSSI